MPRISPGVAVAILVTVGIVILVLAGLGDAASYALGVLLTLLLPVGRLLRR